MTGGTGLLKDQADCPFRALAARRLRADALEEPAPGPAATDRGSLVHQTLEGLWEGLGNSEVLRAASGDDIRRFAAEAAARAMATGAGRRVAGHTKDAVVAWLAELAAAWLAYEKDNRIGDWTVAAHESEASLELGASGLRLEGLRIDRTDELNAGGRLLIDYKTAAGSLGPTKWLGPRPEEPQLPIYALARMAAGDQVAGIAFAHLKARDKMALAGPPDLDLLYGASRRPPKGWPGWEDALVEWRATLDRLADEYARGHAPVDPRNGSACRYCKRQPLCRVFESPALATADEDDEP
jgi:RecB family exonuclease